MGVVSRIGFWSWYLVPIVAFSLEEPVLGALIWGLYAISRAFAAIAIASVMGGEQSDSTRMVEISSRLLSARGSFQGITRLVGVAGGSMLVLASL